MAITNPIALMVLKMRVLAAMVASIAALSSMDHPVQAAMIHVEVQAAYTGSLTKVLSIIPSNTTVKASVDFDIGPGTPNSDPTLSNASGAFEWDNGGPQVFNVSSVWVNGQTSVGAMYFTIGGTGPTIDDVTASSFHIDFDIGTNPFATTEELLDLMLNQASVFNMRIGAQKGPTTVYDSIDGHLLWEITPTPTIPLPAAAWMALPLLGVIGVAGKIRRRRCA